MLWVDKNIGSAGSREAVPRSIVVGDQAMSEITLCRRSASGRRNIEQI